MGPGKIEKRKTVLTLVLDRRRIDGFDHKGPVWLFLSFFDQHAHALVVKREPPHEYLIVRAVFCHPLIGVQFFIKLAGEANMEIDKRKARCRIDDGFHTIDHASVPLFLICDLHNNLPQIKERIAHLVFEFLSHLQNHRGCLR